jgi:hypothetical protein
VTLGVDVILPLHGGERWVAEAIESVLAQTWSHWQLWVVDDASPDASVERVEPYRAAHPERIELVRLSESRRAAGARAHAVALGSGEVLAFLDQDDRWLPEKLEAQVARLEADPALAAVHTDVEWIDADGRPIPGAADAENARRAALAWGPGLAQPLFDRNAIRLVSALVRRSAFQEVGGFDTSLFGGEDWEFWVRLARHFPIAHLPRVLCQRRIHDANVSRVHAAERARGKLRALAAMQRAGGLSPERVVRKRRELLDQAAGGDEPLTLCRSLFARLEAEGLRYCHWKSNEHVGAALAGRTDLDLLVAPEERARLDAVLGELGFKTVVSPPERRFPGMSDRLGFDRDSGRLSHLHLHEQLVVGGRWDKNLHLPIENLLLSDVVQVEGVRTPSPELELLLLAIRAPQKISALRLARRWRRDGVKTLSSSLVREFDHLVARVDDERFRALLGKTGLPLDADRLLGFARAVATRSVTTPDIQRARRHSLRALRGYRRSPAWRATARALRAWALAGAARRGWVAPRKKHLPGRGPLVALVGADGAGKSTLADDLRAWLGWKLEAAPAYFGIPKASRRYRLLRWAGRRLGAPWLESARWLRVARHRVHESRRAARITARGGVVVADRYPLPSLWEPPEPMDGPRLAGTRAAARERALYDRIPPPTRAFALRSEPAVLRTRKDDLDPEVQARKARSVNALQPSDVVAVVDGNREYPDVLLELKRGIWGLL